MDSSDERMSGFESFERFRVKRQRIARRRRITLLLRVAGLVAAIALAKVAAHWLGWEVIQVNPLFTSLVASTVFLLGFLLNGVLSDYKESEKLPGELATGLEVLSLEIQAIAVHSPGADVRGGLAAIADLAENLVAWLFNRLSTRELLQLFHRCHLAVVEASSLLKGDPPLKARLQGEMAGLLKLINRIDTIRETSFVMLVYWLAYAGIALLSAGLVFMANARLYEAIFFIVVIAFLLIFLISLISDLDNPFGYGDPRSAEDVSLDVLASAVERVGAVRDQALRQSQAL